MSRNQQLKLRIGKSTKSERIFGEILKELRIKFKTKVLVSGREIDFIVESNNDKYAIEINGHEQAINKNSFLSSLGYIPIHISNEQLRNREEIKKLIITWLNKQIQNSTEFN